MYRSADYLEDLMDTDPSMPSTNPIYRGAAFQPQNDRGPTYQDPGDDRVTFIGDTDDPTVMYHRSMVLPADLASTGTAVRGGVIFPGLEQATDPNGNDGTFNAYPGQVGAIEQSRTGTWYDTLRPHAGFPLPTADDATYAAVTQDITSADVYGATDPLLVTPGVRIVEERPLDYASRLSMQPSSEQAPYPGFGSALGEWEWNGSKRAMERPVADQGPWFEEPLGSGSLPTPTGAGGAMVDSQGYNLYPQPLTFRAPPTPWDQGTNSENGFYVDGGI